MAHIAFVTSLLVALFAAAARAQAPDPPTIKATSKAITIVDGDDTLHGELVPDLDLDTYVYHPSGKAKTVSFITDVDRIDLQVEPGQTYDFAVLFDGRVCNQRIAPTGPNPPRYVGRHSGDQAGDVIPITLGDHNLIHVQGSFNGSAVLDLIFDTGASMCVLSEKGQAKGAQAREGTDNRLEMAGIAVENTPVKFIDYRGKFNADGIVGYNCFMGKVIWIDYEKHQLVVYDELPSIPEGYQKTDLAWKGAMTLVEVLLSTESGSQKARALFDTGSRWSLSMQKSDPSVATHLATLPSLGDRTSYMADGHRVTSRVVEIPKLTLGGFALEGVQADVEDPAGPAGLSVNILGNDFLKRFNAIIDYQRSEVYLRPNHLRSAPYNPVFSWRVVYWFGAAGIAVVVIGWCALRWRKRARP